MNPFSAPSSSSAPPPPPPVDRFEALARRGTKEGNDDEPPKSVGGPTIDIFENMAQMARAAGVTSSTRVDAPAADDVFERMARMSKGGGTVPAADDVFERMARMSKAATGNTSPTHAFPSPTNNQFVDDEDLESSVHGALGKADAVGRTAHLMATSTYVDDGDDLESSVHGAIGKADAGRRTVSLMGMKVSPPSNPHGGDDLESSVHGTIGKADAARRIAMTKFTRAQSVQDFGGDNRWDKLVRISQADGGRGGDPLTGSRHGSADKGAGKMGDFLDAMVRQAKGRTSGGGEHDLESSCHGSVAKANPSARQVMMSMNATVHNGSSGGNFGSARRDVTLGRASDLGRSLNGRMLSLAAATDSLGSSTHGAISKADAGERLGAIWPRKTSPSPRQVHRHARNNNPCLGARPYHLYYGALFFFSSVPGRRGKVGQV